MVKVEIRCWVFVLFMTCTPMGLLSQNFQPEANEGVVIKHACYSLSYVEKHEQPEWVYYKLTSDMISGSTSRTNDFREDPYVFSKSASLQDFKGSGYDRGHLAPAADMKNTLKCMSESFFLSNMSPQSASFNRGGWRKIEGAIRDLVMKEGLGYVMTGPVLNSDLPYIGPNHVSIPDFYFKAVYLPYSNRMVAYLAPNQKLSSNLSIYRCSVDKLESITGIDFYYQLEDSLEERLERAIR